MDFGWSLFGFMSVALCRPLAALFQTPFAVQERAFSPAFCGK
jgi:hypothetical protein